MKPEKEKSLHTSAMVLEMNSVPLSVAISRGIPYLSIKLSTKALATLIVSLLTNGYASIYLLNSHRRMMKNDLEKADSLESFESDDEMTTCDSLSYGIGDAVFSTCIVAPLVVAVWRGTWGLMDLHQRMFPFTQIFLIGIIIHVVFDLVRPQLLHRSAGAWSEGGLSRWLFERILSRVYTYVFILSNIMQWRGGWGLFDSLVEFIEPDENHTHRRALIGGFLVLCLISLACLRSLRNILASPCFLVTDGKEPTYIFTTRYQSQSNKETALYILDCIFSVTVVGSLVVFVWRGSFALINIYLYPDDPVKSCWISIIIGYALVVVTFALQAPVRWAAARLHGAPRLLLSDVFHLLAFVATVNVWRGIWGILDAYLFPEYPGLSNWCAHGISLFFLFLLNCSNSVLVRGVYIDAEEPAGECVVFPCHYLRLFFHKERTKKRHRKALKAAAKAANRTSEEASVPLQEPEEKV